MRVYFAHSMLDYNSHRETQAYGAIQKLFDAKPLCPNRDIGECSRGMKSYLTIVSWADAVVVLEYEGTVGKGVFEEVAHALAFNIPCWVLRKKESQWYIKKIAGVELLDRNSWKTSYGKIALVK